MEQTYSTHIISTHALIIANHPQYAHMHISVRYPYNVIPRLTKTIRSGITFVSRNTHTDGKDKLLEWPDRSCLLLYVSARIH